MNIRRTCLRTAATALVVVASTALLAACGQTDGGPGSKDKVEITHLMGTTTVTGIPKRIVALGSQWLDAAQALGVTPVGYLDNIALGAGQAAPWEPESLKESKAIDLQSDLVEQVTALHPDLVLAPGYADDKVKFDGLSKLAPTIPSLGKTPVESWTDQVSVLGKILHKPDAAAKVIGDLSKRIDGIAARNPGLAGKTYAGTLVADPKQLLVNGDPKDGGSALFERLGMKMSPTIVAKAGDVGRYTLSTDHLGDLDAALLTVTASPDLTDAFKRLPGYGALPAVRSGGIVFLGVAAGTGLNQPSPLSLPYVLDKLEPALTAVGKK